jgi:hypothetical protein
VTDPVTPSGGSEQETTMQTHATPLLNSAGATSRRKNLGRLAAAMSMLALLAAGPALAWDQHDWDDPSVRLNDSWVDGQLVDVQIRVAGEAAPLFYAPGRFDRHYLQAFAGRNYAIVLKNNTGRRIAVLLAVDGLNVVNGEISSLRSTEPMYVLGPWEQATIRGWRASLDEVRKFVFVDERRSYAQRTGQANSDMGWIRVLAFREQLTWWQNRGSDWGRVKQQVDGGPSSSLPPLDAPHAKSEESKDAAPPPVAQAPQASGRAVAPEAQDNMARGNEQGFPGTGWGERREDRVQRVQFTPEPVALDRILFRYEYASGLAALGIDPSRRGWQDRLATRDGGQGFAKPPRR